MTEQQLTAIRMVKDAFATGCALPYAIDAAMALQAGQPRLSAVYTECGELTSALLQQSLLIYTLENALAVATGKMTTVTL